MQLENPRDTGCRPLARDLLGRQRGPFSFPSFELFLTTGNLAVFPCSEQTSKQLPTVEQQRSAAREMISYFKEKNVEAEFEKNKQLGWVPKAEISNGRWVMFGLLVGILTEYSTGVNFIEQIKLLLVNLSIVDFD
uniref:High light inducible protein n=1 Tax=Chloropicon primus TaxID=1764295 RepID=A0A7S2T833_9CHLO|mmetsp:Transcript_9505/g.27029  ORF Transcript_9505/g.27029 Transcript_9505/m.27029 type:complete len:135 (+) Transcript_9505:400-804(+)